MKVFTSTQLFCVFFLTVALFLPQPLVSVNQHIFELPSLPYSYDALEPYISRQIMELHHTKHQKAYIDGLNAALKDYPELSHRPIIDLLKNISQLSVPENIRNAIRNHGGGVENHIFFWQSMSPEFHQKPEGLLADAITKTWGSLKKFQEEFEVAAKGCFGSGWTWLCLNDKKELLIVTTSNQDSPYMQGLIPLLGLDVWEHAYYLQYENRRIDYTKAWWNVVNWKQVQACHVVALCEGGPVTS